MIVSPSRSIELLLKDIHFNERYDEDMKPYIEVLIPLAKDKDWRALCEMLETFLCESRKGWVSQKLFVFNKYIKEHPLPDKKTEAEYMAEDDKSIQNWVDLINQCPGEKKTIDDYNPATEEYLLSQGLNQRYAHYNWDYLYKIAKQRHCSIDHLERLQGLCSFYVTGGNLCKNKSK